jgi:hypothetical protein
MKGWIASVRLVSEFDVSFFVHHCKDHPGPEFMPGFLFTRILKLIPAWGINQGYNN